MARLVYLGTPELAVAPLRALVDAGHDIALVVSRPDARRGRGATLAPSPVKAAALELGLAVTTDPADVVEVAAELGVVVAYGRIISAAVLDRLAMVNLHFSLLPRWRGAAPVERAILAGDHVTGVCVMGLEVTLDTGPIYASCEVEVGDKSLSMLRTELVSSGSTLLTSLLADGVGSLPVPVPQVGEPTYAEKIDPAELALDFALEAVELHRFIRLERAFTTAGGKRLRVLAADLAASLDAPPGDLVGTTVSCGDGALTLKTVQPEGGTAMDAASWRRGKGASVTHLGA